MSLAPWRLFTLVAFLIAGVAARATEAESGESAPAVNQLEVEPAPVVVWGRTIATYRMAFEFESTAARAKSAADRVEASLGKVNPGLLRTREVTIDGAKGMVILSGNQYLFTLMEGDLEPGGSEDLHSAANDAVAAIRAVATDYAQQHSWSVLLNGIIQSIVATAIFVALWTAFVWLRSKAIRRVVHLSRGARQSLRFLGYDWRPALMAIGVSAVRVVFLLLILSVAYVWMAYVLSRFPYTRHWSEQLGNYLVSAVGDLAVGGVHQIPNLIALLVIFVVTRGLIRILNGWFAAIESGRFTSDWFDSEAARATRRLAGIGIWIVALVIAFPYLPGSRSEAFRGISVFVGLMLSLGGAGFVGQIIGGLAAVYSRAVRVGDFVAVGETQGVVKDLGLFSAKIVTRNHEEVTIPNSMLMNSAIRNFSRGDDGATAISTTVTIGYDTPWRLVESMLCEAAARTDGVKKEPMPVVRQTVLDDFYVRYELNAWLDAENSRSEALDHLHENIQDVFSEKGVQIMSPPFNSQPAKPVVPQGNKE